jgi:hypothetical protein
VSQSGAKIEVEGTLDVLQAKEFFMLLSIDGSRLRALRAGVDRRHHGRRALHHRKTARRKPASAKAAAAPNSTPSK